MSERAPGVTDGLLAWAAVGSRISGFHHDSASKLQSLMMALDEAQELLGGARPDLARPLETALTALKELHALLTENRALAKAPVRKDVALASLLTRAAARVSVKLAGTLGSETVHVAPASFVQAISLLCDVLAGPLKGARTVEVGVEHGPVNTLVSLTGTAPASSALDAITVATWLVEREDGRVFSAPRGFLLHVPTNAPSAATP